MFCTSSVKFIANPSTNPLNSILLLVIWKNISAPVTPKLETVSRSPGAPVAPVTPISP